MFEVTVTAPQAQIARVVEQLTRRQIAARLRAAGDASVRGAERQAAIFLRPRSGNRRRYPGTPHVHNNFRAEYTGLDEFSQGIMEVTLLNPSPIMSYLEYGTGPHDIFPVNAKALSWPGLGRPVKHVRHRGSKKNVNLMRNVISSNIKDRFPGVNPRFTR